jgi:type II secretory pathway component PulF
MPPRHGQTRAGPEASFRGPAAAQPQACGRGTRRRSTPSLCARGISQPRGGQLSCCSCKKQASLFRILGAFVHAGIPLLQGLSALALQGETPRLRELTAQVHKHVSRGNRLSEGLGRFGEFDDLVLPLLQAAESSGKLDEVFRMLSEHLDDKQDRRRKVQSALVYPSLVLGAGVTMALTVPPMVLKDQLRSFGTVGLPLPTRMLLFMSHPLFWLLLLLGAGVIWRCTKIPGWQGRLPVLKRVYASGIEVSLATTLALQLGAGVALLPAVENSIHACRLPRGDALARGVLAQLREGEPLVRALRLMKVLRKTFLSMLASGEEAGKTVEALEWNARVCKLEYEQCLDNAVRLLEPAVMVLLGIIVGVIALGSLLPTLQLLQTV